MSLDDTFDPEQWRLDKERSTYLRNRGFEVIEGSPSDDEQYPYMTLRDFAVDDWDYPGATYHQDRGSEVHVPCMTFNPATESESNLVLVLAAAVASGLTYDRECQISVPGQRIKVFVEDPAWLPVAQALVEQYNS